MTKGVLGVLVSPDYINYVYIIKRTHKDFILTHQGKLPLQDLTSINEPARLTETIKEVLTKENISPSKICVTLSPENFFIHFIKLPTLPEAELNEIIGDEIKKVPKFSGKEFDYIYIGYRVDTQRQRVLFCAIEKNILDLCIQGVRNTGMRLESLEASPLNLMELLYLQVAKEGVEAILFLDDKASYVIIFGQNECRILFKMATGASDLESPKGGIETTAFSAWIDEIKRIFKSYQREFTTREFEAKDIDKIWLVWDEERMKGLYEFTARELEQEIVRPIPEHFGLKLEGQEPTAFNPINLLSLAGPLLYLKGAKRRFNFKHFLHKLKLEEVIKRVGVSVLVYIAAIGFLLGIVAFHYTLAAKKILAKEKEIASRIVGLEREVAELRKERDSYLDAKERLLNQATFVRMLNRLSWSEILANIGLALPDDISLSSFSVSEKGGVKLEGATINIESVAELIRKISEVSFLEDVKFDFLKERQIKEKDIKYDRIIEFGIITKIKATIDEKK